MKKYIAFLLVCVLSFSMLSPITMSAEEICVGDLIIAEDMVVQEDCTIEGIVQIKSGVEVTIPEGVVVTVKTGGSIQVKGKLDIEGKLVVEDGGTFYRKEYLIYQQIIGTEEEIGSGYTPLLGIRTGSVEVTNDGFHLLMGTSVRVGRSSVRLWDETWKMDHETELIYDDGVKVNVTIEGPDVVANPLLFARIVFGFRSGNTELGLSAPNTYYWIYDSENNCGKWEWFNGLAALSGDVDNATPAMLTWANAFWHNARMLEPELTEEEGLVLKNQIYDDSRETRNQYNLYIPSNLSKEEPVSLILFTHGGSWTGGAKEDMDYMCARMTRQGYITATIDYRLFDAEVDAATCMDDILDDMELCINTIYDQVADMGYTIDKMATSGYSAGGHLALLYAYARPDVAKVPVVLVFEQVGPAEFSAEAFKPGIFQFDLLVDSYAEKLIPGYKDMSSEEKEAALEHISPVSYVTENSVPTVMTYATQDIIVGYNHGTILEKALIANNVEHVFYTMEKSNHTCEFDSAIIDAYLNSAYEYCNKYLTSQK